MVGNAKKTRRELGVNMATKAWNSMNIADLLCKTWSKTARSLISRRKDVNVTKHEKLGTTKIAFQVGTDRKVVKRE